MAKTSETSVFFRKQCRLCETHEQHTTGYDADDKNCTYWLDTGDGEMIAGIYGITYSGSSAHRFWIPVLRCPWCGRELAK